MSTLTLNVIKPKTRRESKRHLLSKCPPAKDNMDDMAAAISVLYGELFLQGSAFQPKRKLRLRGGESLAPGNRAGSRRGNPEPLVSVVWEPEGCQGECLTWVVGKVLWLTSFSLSIDDVEVHFHGYSDVLVPILGDLNKKHVLEGSSCHERDHIQHARIPTSIPTKSTQAHLQQAGRLASFSTFKEKFDGREFNFSSQQGKLI